MVSVDELFESMDEIQNFFDANIRAILTILNRSEKLDDFLGMIGMENPFHRERVFQSDRRGKIVVLGDSKLSKNDMLVSAKKMGFSKDRFELHLGYDEVKTLDVNKYRYKWSYAAILVGPSPHSGVGKGDYSSIIVRMEEDEGYPPVVRMGENELKITKSGFQNALRRLLSSRIIEADNGGLS